MKKFTKLALVAALAGGALQASALVLPGVNPMSVGQYGDFYVYSLDLLESCAAPSPGVPGGDARCQPYDGGGPQGRVSSGAGQISDKLVIYADASGQQLLNYDGSGPFPGGDPATVQVDNNFQPPTGNNRSFDMVAGNEPVEPGTGGDPDVAWTGDEAGHWDAKLSSIVSFLNGADLVFLFDNNQDGSDLDQQQFLWGQLDILDGPNGNVVKSYCLNSDHVFGVFDPNSNACATPYQDVTYVGDTSVVSDPGSYVGSGGRFCVDKVTGASYLPDGVTPPSNLGDCTNTSPYTAQDGDPNTASGDGYFVSNNLGASFAEFAAFIPDLNKNLAAWAAAGYFMSIDFHMRGLNDGGEKLWIEGVDIPNGNPEPGTLAMVGLGLLGLAAAARRRRS